MTAPPEIVARLLALAESGEAEARRQLAGALSDQRPFESRHWSEFSARSLVAFVFFSMGETAQAGRMAMRALRLTPDELGARVADNVRASYFRSATKAVYRKRPDLARRMLAEVQEVLEGPTDFAEEKGLLAMLDFTAGIPAVRETPIALCEGRPTVIHAAAWGEKFITLAGRTILPCLLAPGNLPALRMHGTPIVLLHTRAEDIPGFRALPVVQALEREGRVEFSQIPSNLLVPPSRTRAPTWNRMLIGALQYDALMAACRLGADFVPMGADALLSGACLSAAKTHLLAGKEAVVVAPLRSVAGHLMDKLEAGGFRRHAALDVPAAFLYRASLETLHPFIRDSFMRREMTRIPVDPVQFFFPAEGGFVSHAFHLLPLMFSTRGLPADIGCDFQTFDTRLLSDVLVGRDRSAACLVHSPLPGEMYYVALDEEAGVASFGSAELTPLGAAQAILGWINRYEDLEHFIWAINQPFVYPVPPELTGLVPADCRDEREAVAEVARGLQERRPAIFNDLYDYRSPGGASAKA